MLSLLDKNQFMIKEKQLDPQHKEVKPQQNRIWAENSLYQLLKNLPKKAKLKT